MPVGIHTTSIVIDKVAQHNSTQLSSTQRTHTGHKLFTPEIIRSFAVGYKGTGMLLGRFSYNESIAYTNVDIIACAKGASLPMIASSYIREHLKAVTIYIIYSVTEL
jgi:hypothetical protein